MTVAEMVAVVAGGALGSVLRWLAATLVRPGGFPWSTLAVNALGAALLGAVWVVAGAGDALSPLALAALATGLAGGLTTFSTLAVDAVRLGRTDRRGLAVLYLATTVALGLIAAAAGAGAALLALS